MVAAGGEMTRHTYQYVVLRLVPRVEREEFINVGVVLYCQELEFLDADIHLQTARVAALAPGLDQEAVQQSLDIICAVARGHETAATPVLPKLGPRFGWLSAPRSTVVQPGPVHSGTTTDPAGTIRHLMRALVHPAQ